MAYSLSPSLIKILLLPLLVLTLTHFQPSSSNDLVDQICVHNDDPTYCTQQFNSDTRTPGADLPGLGAIGIDIGLELATNISNLIIEKNGSIAEPVLKMYMGFCEVFYDSAKDSLVNASDALGARDYGSMNLNGHLAQEDGLNCEQTFLGPPTRRSPLTAENRNFVDISHAIVVISNMLLNPS